MVDASDLAQRLASVSDAVVDAARESGRGLDDITTIVVTKFHPAALVRELSSLGVVDFGESRHQEAQAKISVLADLDARWHFVGQLQSKKAPQVARYVSAIHSVDRDSVIDRLSQSSVDVFLQVDFGDDPARGGIPPASVDAMAERILMTDGLRLRGLMTVAPVDTQPRRVFSTLRELSERMRSLAPDASALSMGMSGDFRDAIMEGATHLRIGTAITGNRSVAG